MSTVLARADFGDACDDTLIPTLDAAAEPGQAVVMFDDEGNVCSGVAERVEGRITWVLPDWRTWRTGVAVAPENGTWPTPTPTPPTAARQEATEA